MPMLVGPRRRLRATAPAPRVTTPAAAPRASPPGDPSEPEGGIPDDWQPEDPEDLELPSRKKRRQKTALMIVAVSLGWNLFDLCTGRLLYVGVWGFLFCFGACFLYFRL
ncbi:hypothetical protein ABPG75_012786 [Micractinium tetrahymenae]